MKASGGMRACLVDSKKVTITVYRWCTHIKSSVSFSALEDSYFQENLKEQVLMHSHGRKNSNLHVANAKKYVDYEHEIITRDTK